MKLKELMEKRAALVAKLTEARAKDKLTADEKTAVEATLTEIRGIDGDLELEQRMALASRPQAGSVIPKNEKRQYQVRNLVMHAAGLGGDAGFELEVAQEIQRRGGLATQGGMLIPWEKRADNTTTNMGPTIPTDTAQALPYLYPVTVFNQLGVLEMTGLTGDLEIPVASTAIQGTAKGETTASDQLSMTWSTVKMTPKRVPTEVRVSRQSLIQNPAMEGFIQREIRNGTASKIEYYGFQGTGANGEILGIINQTISSRSNSNTTWILADAVACPNTVLAQNRANMMGNFAWVVQPAAATFIESKPVSTNASTMVMQDGKMAGYPVFKTTNVAAYTAAGCLLFGDWQQVIVGSWGAAELIVDPVTLASTGLIKLIINTYSDLGLLRPLMIVKNANAISA